MRGLVLPASLAAVLAVGSPARAAEPDPVVAVAVGAATIVAGFAVGGGAMAATGDNGAPNRAGWMALESSFVLAPFVSHALVGEWGRGALFAAVPAATTLGTIPIFVSDGDAVEHGTLPEQRVMWALFCTGLAASMVGVIDTAFSPGRRVHFAPAVGYRQAGFLLGGTL
ncbi:MAG TPA: hypothetical protein VIF09_23580 [Polyangiaceae bacterium]|jgi:hypothetical protein